MCINPHLVDDLIENGLWTSEVKNQLVAYNGSVQQISGISDEIKMLYKTIWEIPQKTLMNLAINRGPYICQSQSFNVYMEQPNYQKITSMHFYAWKNGLKTGQYYLRTKAASDAIKFTVNVESLLKAVEQNDQASVLKYLNAANPDKKRVKTKKMVLRKKESEVDGKVETTITEPQEAQEDESMKICPRRKPGYDGPCESCSG